MGDPGGGGWGVNSPQKPKICKKWRLYVFYNKYYITDAKIYPVMMLIQIHARGVQIFLFMNRKCTIDSFGMILF